MSLLDFDNAVNWHPCSTPKDYRLSPPLMIDTAKGCYLELDTGEKIIDAISSWWCKNLGHSHPKLIAAAKAQLEKFAHVMFGNTTHSAIINLSTRLKNLAPYLDKVFYAGDGSSATETALKMSLHSRNNASAKVARKHFIALRNGYHGETCGAMSVTDLGIYRSTYEDLLFSTVFIEPPYVNTINEQNFLATNLTWEIAESQLAPYAKTATAIIFEPIVQGAGGMKFYSPDFLKKLALWAKENDVHLIADEIMTGFGRTGKMLACEHAGIEPDFICLGKGLSSGFLAFSAVLTHNKVYEACYEQAPFLHSHTYSGNALAVSLALATLKIFEEEKILEQAQNLENNLLHSMTTLAEETGKLKNVRALGGIVAAELMLENKNLSLEFQRIAAKHGALIRPIGNTLYWLPPLNTPKSCIDELQSITYATIQELLGFLPNKQ